MLRFMTLGLFVLLSVIGKVSGEYCYSGGGIYTYSYYCSPGQTCGSYYGDCRGLPYYAIGLIVSGCIFFLSICIRCCAQANANNARATPLVQTPGLVQVQVHSFGNSATQPPRTTPVHSIKEEAPPNYTAATSSNSGYPKY